MKDLKPISTVIASLTLALLVTSLLHKRELNSESAVNARTQYNSVTVKCEDTTETSLKLKRKCGIPDSILWGDHRIFLYQEGIDAELARKDSIINHWRDSVKIARGL